MRVSLVVIALVACLVATVSSLRMSSSIMTSFSKTSRLLQRSSRLSNINSSNLRACATDSISYKLHGNKENVGVLFLNLGGPEKIADVEGFLFNLFADPDIIRLPKFLAPLQKLIAFMISRFRGPKAAAAYESIGGGSPINIYTSEQAKILENLLRESGYSNAKCYFGMRYWHPYTHEALKKIKSDNISSLVVLPMYPQYSISTSGSSLKELKQLLNKDQDAAKIPHTVIPYWYERKGYINAQAKLILKEILLFNEQAMDEHGGIDILFSAHGVPKSYIEIGDPYQRQIENCACLISQEVVRLLQEELDKRGDPHLGQYPAIDALREVSTTRLGWLLDKDNAYNANISNKRINHFNKGRLRFHLSYQSKVGPIEWLKPSTETKIEALVKKNAVGCLAVVPISFVSEHVETLEEIDLEYKELAEHCGLKHWRRVPALNTDMGFLRDLRDAVIESLDKPIITVQEALSRNQRKETL